MTRTNINNAKTATSTTIATTLNRTMINTTDADVKDNNYSDKILGIVAGVVFGVIIVYLVVFTTIVRRLNKRYGILTICLLYTSPSPRDS